MTGALCRYHAVCVASWSAAACHRRCSWLAADHGACVHYRAYTPHLHTRKQHTPEHHISRSAGWDMLGHAVISASDLLRARRLRNLLLLLHRLWRARGGTARLCPQAKERWDDEAPWRAPLRRQASHAACAACMGCEGSKGAALGVRVVAAKTSSSTE